jgi:hypothetical protein
MFSDLKDYMKKRQNLHREGLTSEKKGEIIIKKA